MARESKAARRSRALEIARLLGTEYAGSAAELCALSHDGPFQLLVATILSAQCTDERVNLVTPELFSRYRDAPALAGASQEEVEELIRSTGFFRSKASHLLAMAGALASSYPDSFPTTMEELTALPGVGRKTANVVLSVALGVPGLPVDTHVIRLSRRLALTKEKDPVKIEADLCELLPPEEWGAMSLRLILHGRRICSARKPLCGECIIAGLCPSAGLDVVPAKPKKAAKTRTPGAGSSAKEGRT